MKRTHRLPFSIRLGHDRSAVSPVIATIITVAIVVVVSSAAVVWFTSFTENAGDTVVQPVSFSPDLNVERVSDELKLKVVVGETINWDDYKVMIEDAELKTAPGTISHVGETVYFDYPGGSLVADKYYELVIVNKKAKTVVFHELIPALSYKPPGTGLFGRVTAEGTNAPVYYAFISLYKSGTLASITTSDISGGYRIPYSTGYYDIVCEVNSTHPNTPGADYNIFIGNITIVSDVMTRLDIILQPGSTSTAVLQGRVWDNTTNTPISHVWVRLTDNLYLNKKTMADLNGFFSFEVPAKTLEIIIEQNGYSRHASFVTLADNETRNLDIRLEPMPLRTAVVFGYVYDNATGSPMIGKKIYAENSYETNETKTNVYGYYRFNVVPGDVKVYVALANYEYYELTISVNPSDSRQQDVLLDKL